MTYKVELSDEVRTWIKSLAPADKRAAQFAIDQLQARGHMLRMPLSRSLNDGLFELRFSCEGLARRITYVFDPARKVFLLTTFRKTRNNEAREVIRARRVKKALEEAQEKKAKEEGGKA